MMPQMQGAATPSSPYWQGVAAVFSDLPVMSVYHITSSALPLANGRPMWVAGRVFECDRRNAAQRIAEGTHRLSTPEEIEAHDKYYAAEALRLASMEEARKNTTVVKQSEESSAQIAAAVTAGVKAVFDNSPKKKGDQ